MCQKQKSVLLRSYKTSQLCNLFFKLLNMIQRTVLCWLLILQIGVAKADIIMPGEVIQGVTILNVNDFPDYNFYLTYYTYKYNRGYQKDELIVQLIESGKEYYTSRHGRGTLSAVHKKDSTQIVCKREFCGQTNVGQDNITNVVEQIKINKIGKEEIEVIMVAETQYFNNGKTVIKKQGIAAPFSLTNILAILVSMLALLLLLWQIQKRKKAATV